MQSASGNEAFENYDVIYLRYIEFNTFTFLTDFKKKQVLSLTCMYVPDYLVYG